MNTLFRALLVLSSAAAAAAAAEPPALSEAWVRATPPGARTAAAYLTIAGAGEADRLLGAETPAARTVELHAHSVEGGTSRMVRLEDIAVPAAGTVRLEPGGLHLMLIDIAGPLAPEATVRLSLRFARAGALELEVPVIDARTAPAGHGAR